MIILIKCCGKASISNLANSKIAQKKFQYGLQLQTPQMKWITDDCSRKLHWKREGCYNANQELIMIVHRARTRVNTHSTAPENHKFKCVTC